MKAIIDTDYSDIRVRFIEAKMLPLCGWLWLEGNLHKEQPEQKMTIFYDGEPVLTVTGKDKPTKKAVKAIMEVAQKAISHKVSNNG
jgi:hypothetical protein